MRSFSRSEIEKKFIELGGKVEGKTIKSEKWTAEILEERKVLIGKLILNAVLIKIEICEKNKKEFLGRFRVKFSRGGG